MGYRRNKRLTKEEYYEMEFNVGGFKYKPEKKKFRKEHLLAIGGMAAYVITGIIINTALKK